MGSFGKALRWWRSGAGLSQAELAEALSWSQSQVSRAECGTVLPDRDLVCRIDRVLNADGELLRASDVDRGRLSGRQREWHIGLEAERIFGSDAKIGTVDQIVTAAEELCCGYSWCDADELRRDCRIGFEHIARVLEGRISVKEHRELAVGAGWLALLLGCVENDLGREWEAEQARRTGHRLGVESSHAEIVAWSFEMSAWFALCRDRPGGVGQYAEAGLNAAPGASVAIQLHVHWAKALARMGDRAGMRRLLDRAERLLARHGQPARPDNHFVVDPGKWAFFAMECHRVACDDLAASEFARQVLRLSQLPDGSERNPMRAGEARLTLAIAALRSGEVEEATEWARVALGAGRRSLPQVTSLVADLSRLTQHLLPKDPAARSLKEELRKARARMPSSRFRTTSSPVP